jgi:micrococcal nuclease
MFWRKLVRLLFGSKPEPRAKGEEPRAYRPRPPLPSTTVGRPVLVEAPVAPTPTVLRGSCWVVDGDTIIINEVRIRLAGIDAPELDHPWGKQSKWALVKLCKGQVVTARLRPELSYDRVVADCYLDDGRDLAAELVRSGLALDWPKFSGGKYRHLEPTDARKRLWRADARQRGRLVSPSSVKPVQSS